MRPHRLGISSALLEVFEPAVRAGLQQLRQYQRGTVHTSRCGAHDGQYSLLSGLRAVVFAVHHQAGGALLRDGFDCGAPTAQNYATQRGWDGDFAFHINAVKSLSDTEVVSVVEVLG